MPRECYRLSDPAAPLPLEFGYKMSLSSRSADIDSLTKAGEKVGLGALAVYFFSKELDDMKRKVKLYDRTLNVEWNLQDLVVFAHQLNIKMHFYELPV